LFRNTISTISINTHRRDSHGKQISSSDRKEIE